MLLSSGSVNLMVGEERRKKKMIIVQPVLGEF